MNGAKITIRAASVKRVNDNLEKLPWMVTGAGVEAIMTIQEEVFSDAYSLCPVQTGALRDSMFQEADLEGDVIHGRVGHGGIHDKMNPKTHKMASLYAIAAHESPARRRDSGGISKWLEKSLNKQRPDYLRTLSAYIATALAGGNAETAALRARDLKMERVAAIHESRAKRSAKQKAKRADKRKKLGYDEKSYQDWTAQRKADRLAKRKGDTPAAREQMRQIREESETAVRKAREIHDAKEADWMSGPKRKD